MITLQSRLRVPEGILSHDLDDEAVLLNLNTGIYLGLDPVGRRIWHLIQDQESLQGIVDAVVQEYDVTPVRCTEDLLSLVGQMLEQKIIEEIA
jgi:Coenzyme PQQ synthesis protein D (PqqD)